MAEIDLAELSRGDQGIEILVELAKSGQIDPWHLDIVDITDKYLRTLDVTREADLRLSGRALFYAAVLLRLKSEALGTEEPVEELPYDDDYLDYDEQDGELVIRPPANVLDRAIARRSSVKQPRRRPTTLVELIAELQRLEALEREGALERGNAVRQREPMTATKLVNQLVHAEDIEGEVKRLEVLLTEWLTAGNALSFFELRTHHPEPRMTFLALLFLYARGRIELEQAENYGDIRIQMEDGAAHGEERAA